MPHLSTVSDPAQPPGSTVVMVRVHTVLVEATFENHFAESFM